MTIGRKIYALIGLGFLGLLGNTFLDSRELASSLKQQKQIELQHLAELALGIVREEHAAVQKSDIAVAEAQKRALARVAALRSGTVDLIDEPVIEGDRVVYVFTGTGPLGKAGA